ncbi:hypothetical protein B0J11DRAFT_527572 [Dendryphion nanum]|uniref:Uncharacterized protein n=1 Tax=Dendryphion nanum TaxID=256645 RepID=A0A9P9IK21_9PLEO|nr:hypothetical protein B0J11DRAFT_527572 [Dendryphion nanum]
MRPWSEDARHEKCTHPPLPKGALAIHADIDLTGKSAIQISSFQRPLSSQQPNTARIFFCRSAVAASFIYKEIGNPEAASTLEQAVSHGKSLYREYRNTLVSYDPRDILRWVAVKEGSAVTFGFSEMVSKSTRQYEVQNQVRLTKDSDNRYTVIWFDFWHLHDLGVLDQEIPETDRELDLSYQRRWTYLLYHPDELLCTRANTTLDFSALLLLDLFDVDQQCFDSHLIDLINTKPCSPIYSPSSTVDAALKERFQSFGWIKALNDKAEAMKDATSLLNTKQVLGLVSPAHSSYFSEKSNMLDVSSNFAFSQCQRKSRDAEELLSLHTRMAQARQSRSMSALTYCAAFFLPLSLSASILSMQSRLRDLDVKMYDFFGLASAFFTFALASVYGQRLVSSYFLRRWIYRIRREKQQVESDSVLLIRSRALEYVSVFFWLLIVASFFVGMFHEWSIGLIMLGAVVGLFILMLLLGISPFFLFSPFLLLSAWLFMYSVRRKSKTRQTTNV